MATLVLQTAGAVVGGLFGPVGAVIGRAVGGLAGAAVDRALLGGGGAGGSTTPKLRNLEVTASTEGTAIARVWGRSRVAGQIIWATRLQAVTSKQSSGGGGKGGPSGGGSETETTRYYANVALGLCEGRIARVARVWADGNPLDLKSITMRVHRGGEDQDADPLIVAKEGAENAPAYRGLAYVVFERLPLEAFGNRVPQLSFEVVRPIGALEEKIEAITLIPGSTEFGYETLNVSRTLGLGASATENRHTGTGVTDFVASLDELEALCPNLKHVSLVVAWFSDDLRAGHCRVAPRVDSKIKQTRGAQWAVCGLERGSARLVSHHEGAPAYGGTPHDGSVMRAIREMKARGLKVTLYPFLMMDVPAGNSLPSPLTGTAPQQAYPWRGRITTTSEAAATAEIASFFGAVRPSHFRVTNGNPVYTGPAAQWSWRRYRALYWDRVRADELPAGLDLAVNSGPLRAVRMLQAILDVGADGVVGPKTLAAARAANVAEIVAKLCDARLRFLRGLSHFAVFGRGWEARVKSIRAAAGALVEPQTLNQEEKTSMLTGASGLFRSRIVWGAAIAIAAQVATAAGIPISAAVQTEITDIVLQIIGIGGAALALWGRLRGDEKAV